MSMRVCPRPDCAELCPPDAETCHECGAALLPTGNGSSRPSHRLAVIAEQVTQLQAVAADLDDDFLSRQVAQLKRATTSTGNRLSFLEATTAATRSDLDSRSTGGRRR